jgi:hypothetical protein
MTPEGHEVNTQESYVSRWELPAMIVLATLLHWLILGLQLPFFTALDRWFWGFQDRSWGDIWLVALLLALTLGGAWLAFRLPRHSLRLALLVALGYALQFGFAWTEGRGLDGLRDRIVTAGHAEFARVAVAQHDMLAVLTRYETLLAADQLGNFARSKPPGQLLLYMLTERAAFLLHPLDDPAQRLAWFQNFASYTWPLVACLAIIPTFYFVTRFADAGRATLACLLYLVAPVFVLITLHADQVFFPLFVMTSMLLAVLAYQQQRLWLSALAGLACYLTLFSSFGLVFVLPLAAASCVALAYERATRRLDWRGLLKTGGGVLGSIAICDILFRLAFNYDVVLRYQNAMRYHVVLRGWDESAETLAYFSLLNGIEFITWIGLPLALLLFVHTVRSFEQLARGDVQVPYALGVMLLLVFVALALFGRTKGEVARLWLFLVPTICVLAANELFMRFGRGRAWAIGALLVLQWGTVYLIKVNQDFY